MLLSDLLYYCTNRHKNWLSIEISLTSDDFKDILSQAELLNYRLRHNKINIAENIKVVSGCPTYKNGTTRFVFSFYGAKSHETITILSENERIIKDIIE